MLKKYLVLVLLVIIALSGFTEGYQGIPWGASPKKVEEIIGKELSGSDNQFMFMTEVCGNGAFITFYFEEGELIKVNIMFTDNFNSKDDHYSVSLALRTKYATPTYENIKQGIIEEYWITQEYTVNHTTYLGSMQNIDYVPPVNTDWL